MKLLDKLLNNIKFDKKYVLFCIIITLVGVITGALFIVILNSADKSLVVEYIKKYIMSLKDDFNYIEYFQNNIINNISILIIIFIIGITYFLFPINILILFYKSFIIGFSISSFILTYKIKGLLISFIYIFPHLIFNLLIIGLMTSYIIKLDFIMIKHIIKGSNVNIKKYLKKLLYILIFSVIIITITTLYESFVCSFLLRKIIKFII